MLSTILAELYNVEPRALIQAVKRNIQRFLDDFMFQLNDREFEDLKSQIVISSWGSLRRANPYAFTEQGVAMLSGVLCNSGKYCCHEGIWQATGNVVNGQKLAHKLAQLKRKIGKHDEEIKLSSMPSGS